MKILVVVFHQCPIRRICNVSGLKFASVWHYRDEFRATISARVPIFIFCIHSYLVDLSSDAFIAENDLRNKKIERTRPDANQERAPENVPAP